MTCDPGKIGQSPGRKGLRGDRLLGQYWCLSELSIIVRNRVRVEYLSTYRDSSRRDFHFGKKFSM